MINNYICYFTISYGRLYCYYFKRKRLSITKDKNSERIVNKLVNLTLNCSKKYVILL